MLLSGPEKAKSQFFLTLQRLMSSITPALMKSLPSLSPDFQAAHTGTNTSFYLVFQKIRKKENIEVALENTELRTKGLTNGMLIYFCAIVFSYGSGSLQIR